MKTTIMALIATFAFQGLSLASSFDGNWTLKKSQGPQAGGVCAPALSLQTKDGSKQLKRLTVTHWGRVDKIDLGQDGQTIGGCSSGWSAFDVDNSRGCSWYMERGDVYDNNSRVVLTNYDCHDKHCVSREVSRYEQYVIQSDSTLLISWTDASKQQTTCNYSRQ